MKDGVTKKKVFTKEVFPGEEPHNESISSYLVPIFPSHLSTLYKYFNTVNHTIFLGTPAKKIRTFRIYFSEPFIVM